MRPFERLSQRSIDFTEDYGVSWLGARLIERLLRNIRYGKLRITLPSGRAIEKVGSEPGPNAVILVRRWRMLRRVLTGGDIGFAEGYLREDWTTPDLTALIRFGARNTEALAPAIEGSGLMRIIHRLGHMLNANTRRGSQRNIEAHYDLGNTFYEKWLDPTMLYSSAIYDKTAPTLEEAQQLKLTKIREKLAMTGGESVLEIGCGWGALAKHLALEGDADVTGISLSPSQLAWAKEVAAKASLESRLDLRLQDYRDIEGQFDRIVSIEMFEAVGEAYWPSYFQALKRCLKPGGRAVLQIISIEQTRFEAYRRSTDFIQKYIFPGGFLPSDTALTDQIGKAGLALTQIEHFGKSYARTLADWRIRFDSSWPSIAAMGFDDRFRRLWDYYLCYCQAAFEEGSSNVGFYTIEHADA